MRERRRIKNVSDIENVPKSSRRTICLTEPIKRAAYCANAPPPASPQAREKFASLAITCLHLAIQLEEQWALLDEYGDYREPGREKKQAQTPTAKAATGDQQRRIERGSLTRLRAVF